MRQMSVIVALVMMLPLSVHAAETTTLQGLMAQLQTLQAMLMQASGLSSPNASANVCATAFAKPIRPGSKGDDVKRLQQFLARDTALYPDPQITGYYGSLTIAAVRRFQVLHGVVSDGTIETTGFGSVGAKTLAAINALLCPAPVVEAPHVDSATVVTNTNAIVPAPASVQLKTSVGGKTIALGSGISIIWGSTNASADSSVRLSLVHTDGSLIGAIASGKPSSGSLFWTLPLPQKQCTGDATSCLGQLADQCEGPLCSLENGRYAIRADMVQNGVSVAHAQAASFVVGDVSAAGSMSGGDALANLAGQFASGTHATTTDSSGVSQSILSLLSALTNPSPSTASSTPTPTSSPSTPVPNGSCTTPWGNQHVASGQQITHEPFFTGGQYTGILVNIMMQCNNGQWQKCDMIGDNCVAWNG